MSISYEIPASEWQSGKNFKGLFVCDFDGTLLRSDRSFSNDDLEALKRLGMLGIARAIATGRSLYSINTIPISNLPVDFLIFSSGAGISKHPDGRIIRKTSLESREVSLAIMERFAEAGLEMAFPTQTIYHQPIGPPSDSV